MNKVFNKIALAFTGLAMAIGVGVALNNRKYSGVDAGTTGDYSLTPDQATTESTATSYITTLTEFTHSGISWKMNQWNPKTLQVKCNQATITNEFRFYNSSAFPGKITKVVITFSAITISNTSGFMFKGGSSQVTSTTDGTSGTWSGNNKVLTWTPGNSDNFTYFAFWQDGKVASGSNYLASSDAIVVTYQAPIYSVTLNNQSATSAGTTTIYEKKGFGFYLDSSCNSEMTTSANGITVPTKTGYTFGGYYTQQNGAGTQYISANGKLTNSANNSFFTSNGSLYAKWNPATYNITYKDKGNENYSGNNVSSLPSTHTYGTATALVSGTKDGYTFDGWYTDSGCTGSAVTTLGATDYTAAITLFAKWTINSYTVTFNKNGHGDDGDLPSPQTIDYNGKVTNPGSMTETGYDFVGWYKEQACTHAWNFDSDQVKGDTILYAGWAIKTYTVTSSIEHGDLDDTSSIQYNNSFDVTIEPDSGYGFPDSITVTMGGNDITGSVTYDSEHGTIYYEHVTGNIVVSGECPVEGKMCSISVDVTNGHYDGDDEMASSGHASVTLIPNSGYKFPLQKSDITVTNAVSWDYVPSTGVITIDGASDDVTITATCPALSVYTINVTETHGTHTGPATIQETGSATLVFTPATNCGQPTDVTVSGATKDSWTSETGTLVLRNPTATVYVTYEAIENELTSITLSTNERTYTLGDPFVMPTVTAHYNVIENQDVTQSPNLDVTGYDPYTTGDQIVTFSYTEGGINKTATYTAKVRAKSIVTTTYYQKCTSMNDVVNGGKYVFIGYVASNTTYYAMPSYTSGNNIKAVAVTLTENYTRLPEANMSTAAVYTLTSTGTTNQYYIGDGSLYLYAAGTDGSTNNYLKGKATTDSTAGAFTISYASSSFSFVAASNNRNTLRFNDINTNPTTKELEPLFSCYQDNTKQTEVMIFKEVKQSTGTAKLIRITATYIGGDKYVDDTISVSDFTVKKQLDTGVDLINVESDYTINVTTLTSTSNDVTVSYTEDGVTKTALVVVPATERQAEVSSVTLVQGQEVVKNYIDWSGTAWDFTDLTVECVWTDPHFNETFDLEDLIESGDATVYPAKPAVGVTSFTVSYSYHGTSISSGTVSGITVVTDYVDSISWTGTTGSHFKAFSGGQLTAAQVGAWHVVPTFAGAGVQSELSFSDYVLKVGDKTISSLPYTWVTEDDGQELSITYGKDVDGNDFVKKNNTAVANICATINAIDHEESHTIEEDVYGYKAISSVPSMSTGDTLSVVIAAKVGNTYYALDGINNSKGTNYTPTVTNSVISLEDAETTWTLVKTDTGFEIKNSSNKYLNYSSGTNIGVGNSSYVWTIGSGTHGTFRISSGTSGRALIYREGSYNVFGGYSTQNVDGSEYFDLEIFTYQVVGKKEKTITVTTHYANQMEHFDAQKAVVTFAKYLNDTMNGTNVCSGSFENLDTAWGLVSAKYTELFGAGTTLNETELAWAKSMLQYATAQWGSEEEAACVERAMKTYEHCVANRGCTPFMSSIRTVRMNSVNGLFFDITKDSSSLIIILVSILSASAIGGYFFLRKKKEN